jgi:hypothetical protein
MQRYQPVRGTPRPSRSLLSDINQCLQSVIRLVILAITLVLLLALFGVIQPGSLTQRSESRRHQDVDQLTFDPPGTLANHSRK